MFSYVARVGRFLPVRGGRRQLSLAVAVAIAALGVAASSARAAAVPQLTVDGPHGIVRPRGARTPNAAPKDMTWHNGAIMTSVEVQPIFWGASWTKSSFVGDKFTGLDSLYAGLGGSHYAVASDEYTGTNGQVTSATVLAPPPPLQQSPNLVDTSSAPRRAPTTSTVLTEVAHALSTYGITPVANGYYPVYVDTPRGGAGYCAWHSWGTINGVQVQFAFFFNLDGDASCDSQDSSGLHSQGLAALANVSAHEYSEARTDPSNGGWYDSSGAENGDKCAWSFGAPLVMLTNGSQWKLQGEWSNQANDGTYKGTDIIYANTSGQRACLAGAQ
jgi:hypothetical protein